MKSESKPTKGMAGIAVIEDSTYKNQFDSFGDQLTSSEAIHTVSYKHEHTEDCSDDNEALLKSVSKRDIVYCIWQTNNEGDFEMAYIGESNAEGARGRIRNHLFKNTGKTNSKINKVKQAIMEGRTIGFTFIEVDPAFYRTAIEEYLINKYKKSLPWNKVGTKEKM